ncbi:MAG: choice-of-anchor B family protein, partial [Bacteroidetes bacterium]|nr:choice-of-anchor B family protein [Bacteroidota bacterium]
MMCWAPKAAAQDGKSHEDRIPAEAAHGKRAGQADLCRDGRAAGYPCEHVHLLSFLPLHELGAGPGIGLNDAWGWVDPETGQRWALVGREDGVAFVEISDPAVPRFAGQLPMPSTAQANVWRDIKVDGWYAFIVADGSYSRQGLHGMQVFDLTQLLTVTDPQVFSLTNHYTLVSSVHNIVINEDTGYAFAVGMGGGIEPCGSGLHIINLDDPANPEFIGCYAEFGTSRGGGGYTHDAHCVVYDGPDDDWSGSEICVNSNEQSVVFTDVTQKQAPSTISVGRYPATEYTHQGW